jgi:hypothetical protein
MRSTKKTEQIQYAIDRNRHKQQLKDIRPTIDSSPPAGILPARGRLRALPFWRQKQIQRDNEGMMSRILKMARSGQAQVGSEGYARYFEPVHVERERSSLKRKLLERENCEMGDRLRAVKPAVHSLPDRKHALTLLGQQRQRFSSGKVELGSSRLSRSRKSTELPVLLHRYRTQPDEVLHSPELFEI